jgi:uncharacterized protein
MSTTMKTALITGASSGIGKALADNFASDGYNLYLTARREKELQDLASHLENDYGISVTAIPADLCSKQGAESLYHNIKKDGAVLHALANNAGFGCYSLFCDYSHDQDLDMINLNINALVILTKLFIPDLIATKGNLLNVASTAAFQPGPYMATYFATKAFVLSFSEAIANELQESGVTVTVLCPGPTETEFMYRSGMNNSSMVKGKKLPTAAEVAFAGYQAMKKGRTVYVHGTSNWLRTQSIRFAPRSFVTRIVKSNIGPADR